MIPFNIPPRVGTEERYMAEAIANRKIAGDGEFTRRCSIWIERRTGAKRTLLTTSCTHALEMAALLMDIRPGDEIIMPSYTFVSTANAFVLRGGVPVFVDVRPDTMNIDESLIEAAITSKTRAIVAVHYAGVCCEMDTIYAIAKKYGLYVVEDAAQGVMAAYNGRALGSIGDIGCFSFHETKNYSMGEGGAILLNNPVLIERAEILREKGTNRQRFLRGMVDKYTWVDVGSSYLPSELNAAHLWAQLEQAERVNDDRMTTWYAYREGLRPLADAGRIEWQLIPKHCTHNAHMFYVKFKDLTERTRIISALTKRGIGAAFHYVPLHSAQAGLRYGRFHDKDVFTTKESERLLRLPLWYGMREAARTVCEAVAEILGD